jgi:LuxR family transcriptional regulator, maltose regulon positive regulatory protein
MAGVNGAVVTSLDTVGGDAAGVTGRPIFRVVPTTTPAQRARFLPPGRRAGEVARGDVLTRLRAVVGECPVVLLNAPAGYGKTTVLAQWAVVDSRPFIWLTVTDAHNDPMVLRQDLTAGIASIQPPAPGVPTLRVLSSVSRPWAPRGRLSVPCVLVLDDAHLLTAAAARRVVDAQVLSMPTGSQVALASRGPLPWGVGRWRTERPVLEITGTELAFTPGEARDALGRAVRHEPIGAVIASCVGWPAAVCLVRDVMEQRADQSPSMTLPVAERRAVQYLESEVLSGVSDADLVFLTRMSVLAELTAAACDAVCEQPVWGQLMAVVRRGHLPITAVDGAGERYLFHPLLRRALLAELRRREPGLIPVLHRRAAVWFASAGDPDGAVRHAISSGDLHHTGEIVWDHTHPGLGTAGLDRLRGWLSGLTDDQIGRSLPLMAAAAWLALLTGDRAALVRWQVLAESWAHTCGPSDATDSEARAALVLLRTWRGAAGGTTLPSPDGLLAGFPMDSRWRPAAGYQAGMLQVVAGDPSRAQQSLQAAEELARGLGQQPVRADCLAALALLAHQRGRHGESAALAERAHGVLSAHRVDERRPAAAHTACVIGLTQALAGDFRTAAATLARARELTTAMTDHPTWLQVQALVLQAHTCLLLGDAAAARQLTGRARRLTDEHVPAAINTRVGEMETLLGQLPPEMTFGFAPMTAAELRVLQLLPTYLTFPEMGEMLFVSRNTVKAHAVAIYRKLGCSTRQQVVHRACALGYLPPSCVPGNVTG